MLEQHNNYLLKGLGRDQSIDSKHSTVIMKKMFSILLGVCLSVGAMAQGALAFDANAGVKSKMTVYDGTEVSYTTYERLFYVTNVEDSAYQFLNVNVPDGATQQTPIFLSANIPLFRKGRELSLGIMPYYHFSGMRLKEDFGLNFGADHHRYGAIVMGTASTRLFGSKNTVDFL